jgi:transcription initiation factor TFIIA large subunit
MSPPQNSQQLSLPGAPAQSNGAVMKSEPDPLIKQEPSNGIPSGVPQAGFASNAARGMAVAQQRAAQALENQYGQRAAASINALQSGAQGQRPNQPNQPLNAQQYRQGVAAAMAAQQQRTQPANGQSGISTSQVDGASDGFEGVLMRQDAQGNQVEMGRVDIDRLLHEQIAARAKQMEGGGLMLPLKEATKHASLASKKSSSRQVDGPDDDDDIDGDAINSDLDDSADDQEDDDDDDETMGHIMLCMYDKVQRVKNKW